MHKPRCKVVIYVKTAVRASGAEERLGRLRSAGEGGNVLWFGGRKTCHSVLDYPFQSSDEMPVLLQDNV